MSEVVGRAILRYARISPKKMKPLLAEIRGKSVKEADAILFLMNKKGARITRKVLKSAVASLREKLGKELAPEEMIVRTAKVDKGLMLKRVYPFWRGMATLRRRRTSHITIEVVPKEER